MRKIYYLAMAVILTVMVGCQKDDELLNLQGKTDQAFYATFENSVGTRTALDSENNVLWSESDKISVFKGRSANTSYVLTTGKNTTFGVFEQSSFTGGTESGGSIASLSANVAYYPYDANVTVSESNGTYTLNANFPAEQTYSVSGTFGNGASPMVAVTSSTSDYDLKFRNVGAIFRLILKGDAKISKVEFSANEDLAGECSITASHTSGNTAAPTVKVNNGSKTITLNCTTPVQLSTSIATNFVVAILPVDNLTGGITVTIYDNEGKKMVHTHNVAKIERSKAYTTKEVDYNGTVEVKKVQNIENIDENILATSESDLAVQVTEQVTGSKTISIPSTLDTETTTFTFENVADDAEITIENGAGGEYDGKIIIEVPEGETIPTVKADIPDGEVYIKQGSVTTLVVSSKKNTTIIGAGVKVGKLTVNQGNVRVENGGVIGEIENNTNGTLYITNAGGTLPQTLSDNTIVVYEDTNHKVVLNETYSADNISDLMSYGKNVLNTTDLSFTLSGGKYEEVVNVAGGKNITFEPKDSAQEVSIAGLNHQSNANPSTVVVKNITLNNTLQTEGWFTGTSPGIGPCVGAWGGIFTFEKCKFIVAGTSGKETGVMTWWITNKMSLTFTDCTFDGSDNHTSARAMQIYGNADLNVTGCTFNTYKEYSLKYVASEGNVAKFNGNKVNNSKYFVQLGSAPYAGNKYTVNINNTTLGDQVVNHYKFDNFENQVVYVDGVLVAYTDAQLAEYLTANQKNISVALAKDIDLPITYLGEITPGSGEYKLGGESTETITIDLNGKKLNITTTYWSAIGAKNDNAKISIKNGTMTSTGNSAGTWNAWDLRFSNCNYMFDGVTFEKAVALDNAGKSTEFKGVTIKDTHDSDTYALWITAEGQTVTLKDGCLIDMTDCTDGRGIKIDNQYVDAEEEAQVTLNVSNTTFKTEEKSAILVKSKKGANIKLSDLDITGVAADSTYAVWVDSEASASYDLVTVSGGDKKQE